MKAIKTELIQLITLVFVTPKNIYIILYFILADTFGIPGGPLKSAELLRGPKRCRIPDLPKAVLKNVLLLTSSGDNILSCGGRTNDSYPRNLDVKGKRWSPHSILNQIRSGSAAVTMAYGVYIFGGSESPTTSEYLPKNSNVWQAGPTIPNGFMNGCGLKISEGEILLIGGNGSLNRILNFNTKTLSRHGNQH